MIARHFIKDDLAVLAFEVAPGRLERVIELPVAEYGKLKRLALVWNACAGLSEKSLEVLANGGGSSGTLAERALAWSLFVAASRPTARRFLERAQGIMQKQGGEA